MTFIISNAVACLSGLAFCVLAEMAEANKLAIEANKQAIETNKLVAAMSAAHTLIAQSVLEAAKVVWTLLF